MCLVLGVLGLAIAKALSYKGAEVLVIDRDSEIIESISDEVSLAIVCDATDKRVLLSQGIDEFDAVVVAIGENFEELLLCCVTLLEIGVKRIVARAHGKNQKHILEKVGITELLSPEDEVGIVVAERLLNPGLVSYMKFPDDFLIVEIKAPAKFIGRTLEDINLRDKYKLSLIMLKRKILTTKNGKNIEEQHTEGVPSSKTIINPNDTLVLFGKNKDLDRLQFIYL